MPSLFAALAAAAGATVDAVLSECFVLEPCAPPTSAGGLIDVNGRPHASTVRPQIPFAGTFVAAGAILHAHGRSMADSTTRPVVSEKPMIDVAVAALTQIPVQGDRIRRLDTGQVFEVTRDVAEDLGRAWIHLAEKRSTAVPPR